MFQQPFRNDMYSQYGPSIQPFRRLQTVEKAAQTLNCITFLVRCKFQHIPKGLSLKNHNPLELTQDLFIMVQGKGAVTAYVGSENGFVVNASLY
jgi:hypothetical protein